MRLKHLFTGIACLMIFSCNNSKKAQSSSNSLEDTEWRLVELMGKPVPKAEEPMKDITLKLSKDGNRASGFSGCNNYTGTFSSPAEMRLSFSQMAVTKKACMNGMETEDQYLKVLAQADNYTINGNMLSLNKARMAPLARFEKITP